MNSDRRALQYLSVCSGIEAATQAWHRFGWKPFAFSEIDKFPSAVLAHHYPNVPNLGDMTKFQEWPDAAINVLVGGTPCQSFSVAGLRKGLADPRGNLMLTYGAIAGRYRPDWLVWENVPGVLSSNKGRDFGTFLGMLAELGYGFAYRVLDAQYVRACGLPFAVPQKRRRVFVVGYLGDWRRAAAVLFDRESLSGDPAPSRETRQSPAPDLAVGFTASSFGAYAEGVGTIRANGGDLGGGSETLAVGCFWNGEQVTQTLDAVLEKGQTMPEKNRFPAVLVPSAENQPNADWRVRKLTPREAERLQGFPDDFTQIPWRKKSAAQCPDGPRYKALGNSMAVNVMEWIGERIAIVDAWPKDQTQPSRKEQISA